ncbi:hypothetical protein Tco_0293517, partial [Tanacetum coccineum]
GHGEEECAGYEEKETRVLDTKKKKLLPVIDELDT